MTNSARALNETLTMRWKDELKAQLAAVDRGQPERADDRSSRALLEETLRAAAKVLKFAATQLSAAKFVASADYGDDVIRLTVEKCLLEVRLIVSGQALNVRRETGVVDLLYVKRGTVVDSRHQHVSSIESYFVGRIIDLAADSKCEPVVTPTG